MQEPPGRGRLSFEKISDVLSLKTAWSSLPPRYTWSNTSVDIRRPIFVGAASRGNGSTPGVKADDIARGTENAVWHKATRPRAGNLLDLGRAEFAHHLSAHIDQSPFLFRFMKSCPCSSAAYARRYAAIGSAVR